MSHGVPGIEERGRMIDEGGRLLTQSVGHHAFHGEGNRLLVFSGRGNPELGAKIAAKLGGELGRVQLTTFADGEIYCKYEDSVRGADVFLVQSTGRPVNENLMELLIMIQAARLASAKRITAVIPYYGYCRQDKKSQPREPITAKLVADLLQAAGADRALTMDLHAGQLQGFFDIPVDHMTALPMLADYFKFKNLGDIVVVSPDAGGVKTAKRCAERLDAELAILSKVRPTHNQSKVLYVIGNVTGKTAVIVDDLIDTAGTLCNGAQALIDQGAVAVYAAATHAVLSDNAYERIAQSVLEEVVVTDTVPLVSTDDTSKITVLSIASILADTIHNVFNQESVSELFHGENQLF
jgi:ribose-phosphate pyrophosphokinase